MDKFAIDIQRIASSGPDDPHSVALRCGDIVFTRLLRQGQDQLDDYLHAPPGQLAFWLVDNWWRLRHECVPAGIPSAEWRLAHDMASIGGGYVWPRLGIWGEGGRVGLASRSDPPGVVGPVRYITDALLFVSGDDFEQVTDAFLRLTVDEHLGFGSDRDALRAQIEVLQAERSDPGFASWRRLEAQLGFDPDTAPDNLMKELAKFSSLYGEQNIEEVVQAYPSSNSVRVLNQEIAIATNSGWDCDFSAAIKFTAGLNRDMTQPPWKAAEEAGNRIRKALDITSNSIENRSLADLVDISERALDSVERPAVDLPYGLRLKNPKNSRSRLAFRGRWSTSRRFELCRAVGDAIWANSDSLGPLARSKTARQKFQRAFAQALLCPFDDLMNFMETSDPTDDDIVAAARYFDVSDRVVRTTLVNKNVIERVRLEDLVEAA